MESKRQQKIAKLILKEMGDIFQKKSSSLFNGAFITVSDTSVTPDLSIARIYVSFMLAPKPEALLEKIKDHTPELRHELGNRVRNQLRIIPELHFYMDTSFDEASRMDKLIDDLKIPKKPDDNEEKNDS